MKSKLCLLCSCAALVVALCGNEASVMRAENVRAAGPNSSSVTWVKYEDPMEQAFTVEVPKGWTVSGGMFRLGYSDHRPMIDMTSPDGTINIRVGDVAVGPYFLADQFHHEGEIYPLGAQGQPMVAHYRTGQQFAEAYGKARFTRLCDRLMREQATMAPPAKAKAMFEQSLKDRQRTGNSNLPASDGEVVYDCESALGQRTAFAYVQTGMFDATMWIVGAVDSYVAPAGQLELARSILDHLESTIQNSAKWQQKQEDLDRQGVEYQRMRQQQRMQAFSQQVAQFEAQMQSMRNQVSAFERGQAQRQSQFQKFDNVIVGITPTVDPFGNEVNASTGPKYSYWRNPATGQTVNANSSPGPGWQQLTPKHP